MTWLIQAFCFQDSGEKNDKPQIPINPENVTFSERKKPSSKSNHTILNDLSDRSRGRWRVSQKSGRNWQFL